MKKFKRAIPVALLMLWDCVCVVLSFTFSIFMRYSGNSAVGFFFSYSWFYIPIYCLIFVAVSRCFKRYSGVLRHFDIQDAVNQFASVVVSYALFYIVDTLKDALHLFDWRIEKTSVFVIAATIAFLLTVIGRSAAKLQQAAIAKLKMRKENARRILIYGAGEAGVFFKRKQDNHPDDCLLPVVFIDDDEKLIGKTVCGIPVYGGRDKLAEAIDKFDVDEVIVAVPTAKRELFKFTLGVCQEKKCAIRRFGTLDDVDLNKATLTDINYEDLLHRDGVKLDMDAVNRFVRDKVVMVTGGCGSIGSEICRQVLQFGCKKLIVFDFNENGLYYINNELSETYDSSRYELRLGSIRDPERLNEVMDEFSPQVIFHAAAHKHVPMSELNPREAIKNNVFGTYKTAKAAIDHRVEKFILISTDKAVNPTNIMGATKRVAELIIQMLDTVSDDTDFAAVRFGNVLGSAGSVVPFFKQQIEHGGPVTVTHRDMRRYFMTIPEAVQLVLEAGAMADGGEIFVLDMGEPVRIYDLACDLIRLAGHEPNEDIKIEITGLRPGEKMFEEIHMESEDFDNTRNEKIYIMKPIKHDLKKLRDDIGGLDRLVSDGTFSDLFAQVKKLVPTFDHSV